MFLNMEIELKNVISTMSKLTKMEYAIFDTNSKLVSSTQIYLERKGRNVHTASIVEVLNQGNVVVNKPGHMVSCFGCRFVNNCPATIEILSCINLNNEPIGVLSLTSFSQTGHNLIEKNLRHYMELTENISNLISMYAANENSKLNKIMLHRSLDLIINDSKKNLILVDKNGSLIHWNRDIQNFFSYCNLYTQTIYQMFPEEVTNWLFSTKKSSKKYFNIEGMDYIIYSQPLIVENDIVGFVLNFEKKDLSSDSQLKINNDYLDAIITDDNRMMDIKEMILKISSSSSSVLITGETGTGKEIVAKAIHYTGNRKGHPFIPMNCANIPESLFESELFGYEDGAFTGAKKGGKIGLFEIADEGTIFLDEIGELPIHLQSKLLRVLQDNTIQRVGGTNPIPINVRIIAATNRDLEIMMEEGKFRDDLYYRLCIIPIETLSLRERISDIECLSYYFINKYNKKLNKNIKSISKKSFETLMSYSWPGNIRELENTIEYAINMEETETIQMENLPKRIIMNIKTNNNIKDFVYEKEYQLIISLLDKNGWDINGKEQTANELGISLRTLYRKLKGTVGKESGMSDTGHQTEDTLVKKS